MIAVGVDTHKHEHFAAALNKLGELLGEVVIPANQLGYQQLADWLKSLGNDVLVGIEGAGSYGAGLCEHLQHTGVQVVEVERPRRRDRRTGKSDRIDALLAAKHVLAGEGLATPRAGGERAALQALLLAYRSCVSERTRLRNQIQSLHVTAPIGLRERIGAGNGKQLARRLTMMRVPSSADVQEATVLGVLYAISHDVRERWTSKQTTTSFRSPCSSPRSTRDCWRSQASARSRAASCSCATRPASGARQRSRAPTAPRRSPLHRVRRYVTASAAAGTAKSTTRSTRSLSHARSTTPKHAST